MLRSGLEVLVLRKILFLAVLAILGAMVLGTGIVYGADNAKPAIPGITVNDDRPNGCIDCHKKVSDAKDYSLPAEIKGMAKEGKHPDVASMIKGPATCLTCHSDKSKNPLGNVLHKAHLTGDSNHFVASYGAQCMNCHGLDKATGKMDVKGF